MRPFLLLIFGIIIVCYACNNNTTRKSALSVKNLKSAFMSIHADSAYRMQTPGGAIIRISKNTFEVSGKAGIELEIKEAYSMQDILLAGLTTESNGKPLKSAGMIYINATSKGETLTLLKPIDISIPSESYDSSMQLFKGEIKYDSTINWVEPQPMDTSPVAKNVIWGKEIFKANCANCHKVYSDFVAPALAKTMNRIPNKKWLYDFIASPATSNDAYSLKLKEKWRPTIMTAFPFLEKEAIDAIIAYVDNEVALNPSKESYVEISRLINPDSTKTSSPCGVDTVYYVKDTVITLLDDEKNTDDAAIYIGDTDNLEEEKPVANANATNEGTKIYKAIESEGTRDGFTLNHMTQGMYDFKIKALGWYNIDSYVEGYPGSSYVTLNAQLQMDEQPDMELYVFCPERKMLSISHSHSENKYSFDMLNGKLPLFLNDNAIILAIGSDGTNILYGTAAFTVESSQTIDVKIKKTSEEEIIDFIRENKIDGIKIDAIKKDFEIIKTPCDDIRDTTVLPNNSVYSLSK